MDTKKRLEELRVILRSESISYDELHELQDFGERGLIEPDDVELLEAAGVPEQRNDDMDTRKLGIRTVSHMPRDFAKHGRYHLTINEKMANGHGPDLMRAVGSKDGEAVAAELVRRWNAYPELVEALQEANGTLAAIAEMSQRHDPETGFLRDLSPYDTYRSLLPCFQRLNALLDTLKTN